jgi:hypothetical protein
MSEKLADHVMIDLSRLVEERVSKAVDSVSQLGRSTEDYLAVVFTAALTCIFKAAGAFGAVSGKTPEDSAAEAFAHQTVSTIFERRRGKDAKAGGEAPAVPCTCITCRVARALYGDAAIDRGGPVGQEESEAAVEALVQIMAEVLSRADDQADLETVWQRILAMTAHFRKLETDPIHRPPMGHA